MVDVGDLVGQPQQTALQGLGLVGAGVAENATAHLVGQVESLAVPFQTVHYPKRLLVMGKASGHDLIEDPLSGVSEGGVAQIVAVGGRFCQILIEA